MKNQKKEKVTKNGAMFEKFLTDYNLMRVRFVESYLEEYPDATSLDIYIAMTMYLRG